MLDPPKMEPKLKVLPVTVVASSPASTDEVTLLPQGAETSDAPVYNTQSDRGLRVVIVSLIPLRITELHLASADETIGLLKSRFLDTVYSENPSMREQQQQQQLDVRLFYDGIRLEESRSLRSYNLTEDGRRIVAMELRAWPVGLSNLLADIASRWWPLLMCAFSVLMMELIAANHISCSRLATFVYAGAPMLLPYSLVLSGASQEETGYRYMWFFSHSNPWLLRVIVLNAIASFAWLFVGASWLFGDEPPSSCGNDWPLVVTAHLIWLSLLVASLPPLLAIAAPFCILCRCGRPLGFAIIALLAGVHRPPKGCRVTHRLFPHVV